MTWVCATPLTPATGGLPSWGMALAYSYLNTLSQLSRPMSSGHHISMEIPTTEPLTALGGLMMVI